MYATRILEFARPGDEGLADRYAGLGCVRNLIRPESKD